MKWCSFSITHQSDHEVKMNDRLMDVGLVCCRRVIPTWCICACYALTILHLKNADCSMQTVVSTLELPTTVCILQVKYGKRVTSANTSGWYFTSTTNKSNVHQPIIHLHFMNWLMCDAKNYIISPLHISCTWLLMWWHRCYNDQYNLQHTAY